MLVDLTLLSLPLPDELLFVGLGWFLILLLPKGSLDSLEMEDFADDSLDTGEGEGSFDLLLSFGGLVSLLVLVGDMLLVGEELPELPPLDTDFDGEVSFDPVLGGGTGFVGDFLRPGFGNTLGFEVPGFVGVGGLEAIFLIWLVQTMISSGDCPSHIILSNCCVPLEGDIGEDNELAKSSGLESINGLGGSPESRLGLEAPSGLLRQVGLMIFCPGFLSESSELGGDRWQSPPGLAIPLSASAFTSRGESCPSLPESSTSITPSSFS